MPNIKRNEEYTRGEKLNGLFFFGGVIDHSLYLLNSCTAPSRMSPHSSCGAMRRSDWEVIDLGTSRSYYFALSEYSCFDEKDFEGISL